MNNRPDRFLKAIFDNFGWRFALTLVSAYFGLKGIAFKFLFGANLPYFKSLGVTGTRYQTLTILIYLPWTLKATFGILCDTIPLFGYHKLSYILVSALVGTCALTLVGTLPLTASTAVVAALLLIPAHIELAVIDLLTEAKYAELMVQKPETGASLLSYATGILGVGSFLASIVLGPLADAINPRYLFLITAPFALQPIIPVLLGWFPEKPDSGHFRIKAYKLRSMPNLLSLISALTIGTLVVSALIFAPQGVQTVSSIVVTVILSVLSMLWLPREIGKVNLFLFLTSVFRITILGALDYFFTASHECVSDGPHFSMTFYLTTASIVSSAAIMLGVAAFQQTLSKSSFRTALCITNIVKILSSVFDYMIVTRTNVALGIPDRLFFLVGEGIITPVVVILDYMTCSVLMSKLCPVGMEATMYALLASFNNFGNSISQSLGVFLIQWTGIQTVLPCDFSNLPTAIVIAHALCPALIFPLVFLLIPNLSMIDDLRATPGTYHYPKSMHQEEGRSLIEPQSVS